MLRRWLTQLECYPHTHEDLIISILVERVKEAEAGDLGLPSEPAQPNKLALGSSEKPCVQKLGEQLLKNGT